jgi:hypothetical protein
MKNKQQWPATSPIAFRPCFDGVLRSNSQSKKGAAAKRHAYARYLLHERPVRRPFDRRCGLTRTVRGARLSVRSGRHFTAILASYVWRRIDRPVPVNYVGVVQMIERPAAPSWVSGKSNGRAVYSAICLSAVH